MLAAIDWSKLLGDLAFIFENAVEVALPVFGLVLAYVVLIQFLKRTLK